MFATEPQLVFPTAAPLLPLISGITWWEALLWFCDTAPEGSLFPKYFVCLQGSQRAFNLHYSGSSNYFSCNYPQLWHWNHTNHVVSFGETKLPHTFSKARKNYVLTKQNPATISISLHSQTPVRLQTHSHIIPEVQAKAKPGFSPFQTPLKQTRERNSFLVQVQEQALLRNTAD